MQCLTAIEEDRSIHVAVGIDRALPPAAECPVDGMLSGVNIEATLRLAQALTIPVIASGGLSSVEDIRRLCEVEREGVVGTIAGRAIYDGTLDFKAAQAAADAGTA